MPSTQEQHQQFRDLLARREWDEAQSLWLTLAEQVPDQLEILLLLIKELADAGQANPAAELATLLASDLKSGGKHHEWLYALKIQARASSPNKSLRTELSDAYQRIYEADQRLKTILSIAELDQPRTPLATSIARIDTLLALQVGSFCQHKSWGVGRVKTFDGTLNRLVVAFPHNPDHAMQLSYAAESLTPLSAEHLEVRKLTDLESLKQLASTDPAALLRIVLLSHGHAATADRIESSLSGSVVAAHDWKKWWENAKKLLKRDPHFELPSKKTDPIVLRTAPVSQQDELSQEFQSAPSLAQKIEIARQLLKIVDDINDPELLLQEFQDGLIHAVKKARPEHQAQRLEAALLVEELRAHQHTPPEQASPLVADLLARIENLPEVLDNLSLSAQKRAIAALKASHPERLRRTINSLPSRALDEIADLLPQEINLIAQLVQNQKASPELLHWLCKNVKSRDWLQPLQTTALLQAVLNSMESAPTKARNKLRDALFDDETLLVDLLANANTDLVRSIARQLLASPALEELDRRSLMARLVKEFPFVQEFLTTKTSKEQPLIVSWASYHKRRAELDDIVQKKIPQNSKEIAQARSYGDLRENFEYKAAKDTQKLLMRRRAELEILLARAQATDFADAKTAVVNIGTTVTVADLATNEQHTYHILGAWDSDPARGIISYPAALAQSLLNKKAGDIIEANSEIGTQRLRVDRIEKAPITILQSL